MRKKRRRLPRDAANDQAFASLLDLPGDEVGERLSAMSSCSKGVASAVSDSGKFSGLLEEGIRLMSAVGQREPLAGSGTANRIAAATARLMEAFAMNYLQSLSGSFEHRTASARRPNSKAA